jgi:hypothetical protein
VVKKTELIIPIAVTLLLLPTTGISLYHGWTWGQAKRKDHLLSDGLAYLMLHHKLKNLPFGSGD